MEVSPIARCSCDGNTCRCLVKAGDGIVIRGSGQSADPYIVESTITGFSGALIAQDTPSLNLNVAGSGTAVDPFVITGTTAISMETLSDVDDPSGPALGEVPVFNGSKWEFAAPPTVPPGQVRTGGGILGDGTLATPIRVAVSDTTTTTTAGLPIYVDSAGQLRANASSVATNVIRSNATGTRRQAVVSDAAGQVLSVQTLVGGTATSVFNVNEQGVITIGFIDWGQVSRKPATFPPDAHTQAASTITSADPDGRNQRAWNDVIGPRVQAMAGSGGYGEKANRPPTMGGRAVMDVDGANSIGLRWNGSRPVVRVDVTEFALPVASDLNTKANFYTSVNDVRFSQGPTGDAYARGVGAGAVATWMDSSLQFGRSTSSIRFKEDVTQKEIGLDAVLSLSDLVVTYHRIGTGDVRELGMIAEEVNGVLPEVVTWFGAPIMDENGVMIGQEEPIIDGIRYDLLALPALAGIRHLYDDMKDQAESWKRKHDLVLSRLRKIEAAIGLNEED